jgi:hypothetical protein
MVRASCGEGESLWQDFYEEERGFLASENNIDRQPDAPANPAMSTLEAAKLRCRANELCGGFTYDLASPATNAETGEFEVFFKDQRGVLLGLSTCTDCSWRTFRKTSRLVFDQALTPLGHVKHDRLAARAAFKRGCGTVFFKHMRKCAGSTIRAFFYSIFRMPVRPRQPAQCSPTHRMHGGVF